MPGQNFEQLAKDKFNGCLFIHRDFTVMNSTTGFYSETYYVLRDGVVYHINNDLEETKSDDKAFELVSECECLGSYNPKLIKKRSTVSFSMKKAFQLLKKINGTR